jgi:hypothetical protein
MLTWTGGTMNGSGATNANGGIALDGLQAKKLDARTLNNNGTATWTNGNFELNNGAAFNNSGTFRAQANNVLQTTIGTPGTFNNIGTFQESAGTDITTVSVPFTGGAVDIQTGALSLDRDSSINSISVAANAALVFAGTATAHFQIGGLGLTGAGDVNFSGGTIEVDGPYTGMGAMNILGGTVTFGGTVTNIGPLNINNGTVNFASNNVTTPSGRLSGGTLLGLGTLHINGDLTWSGTTMADPGSTSVSGTLVINGAGAKVLDGRTLQIGGDATWDAGPISVNNGASIINQRTFRVQTDQPINSSGATGTFNNQGTFAKSSSLGITSVNAFFANFGLVAMQSGILLLGAGGLFDGTTQLENASALNCAAGTFNLQGLLNVVRGAVIFSGGSSEVGFTTSVWDSLNITGGSVTFRTPISPLTSLSISGGTANFLGNNVAASTGTLSGGTLLGSGDVRFDALTWSGTTMRDTGSTSIGGTLTISGSGGKVLDGRTLFNFGTATWTGGFLQVNNGALISNFGTFDVQTDGTIFASQPGPFLNSGTFQKSAGTGTTVVNIPFVFNSSANGVLDVQTGTLILIRGATGDPGFTGGFTVEQGATLNFADGTFAILAPLSGAGNVAFSGGSAFVSGPYNVTGATTIDGGSVTFFVSATGLGTLTINTGTADFLDNNISASTGILSGGTLLGGGTLSFDALTWSGTDMADLGITQVSSGGTLAITGAANKFLDGRTLINNGTATLTGAINLRDGQIINNGTFNWNIDQALGNVRGNGTFTNTGVFIKAVATGPTTFNIPFVNAMNATVDVQTGTLFVAGGGTNNGNLQVDGPATLTFSAVAYRNDVLSNISGPGAVVFDGGTTDLLGTYSVTGITSVLAGSTVTFDHDASSGTFMNAGTVTIPGVLLAVGSYTQTGSVGVTNLYGGTLFAANPVTIQGGAFVGFGTINGDVSNSGRLTIGGTATPGTLTITGNYTQTAGGVLNIKIGGLTAGTQFDQLNIQGQASLAGTLNIQLIDMFLPAISDPFQILVFASHSGEFASYTGLSLGGAPPRHLTPTYGSTDLTLVTDPGT